MKMKLGMSDIIRSYCVNHVLRCAASASKMYNIQTDFNKCVDLAVRLINLGNVIAIPTDTVYGLASNAQNNIAVQNLYSIKGRDFTKPISICVSETDQIRKWGHVEHISEKLLRELLPGPVTIIVERTSLLNIYLNPNMTTVAVRIPRYNFVHALTKKLDTPLALTSANKSNDTSSVCVKEFSSLWPLIDAVFDGGNLGLERQGSTIVDLSSPKAFKIVREGSYVSQTVEILKKYNLKWES